MAIEIDIQTKADSAKKDLDNLNKSLASLVNNSNSSSTALDGIASKRFKNINEATESFKKMGDAGKASLGDTARSAKQADNVMASLGGMAMKVGAAFAAFQAVRSFNKMSDDLIHLQNKLRLVVKDTQELVDVQNKLYKVSKETSSSLIGAISVYSDFRRAAEKAGDSTIDIFALTKTVQQSAALSGSSLDSINAALQQFSQGLSSGSLAGEELRSILEQMPYLAHGIAKQLNMTTGSLKKFASEGGLSPKVVMRAIRAMREDAEIDFAKTTVTVEQSLGQMMMAFKLFFGEFDHQIGFSQAFAKGLLKIRDSVDIFAKNLGAPLARAKLVISNYLYSLTKAERVSKPILLSFKPEWLSSTLTYSVNKARDTFEGVAHSFRRDTRFLWIHCGLRFSKAG